MKALICELCSSNDFLKHDGFFRCQSCNTAYTLEEARKIMSVSIDRTDETDNLLLRAQRFLEENNFTRASEYCEKVLDIDANNQKAVLLSKKIQYEVAIDSFEKFVYQVEKNSSGEINLAQRQHSYKNIFHSITESSEKTRLDNAWARFLTFIQNGKCKLILIERNSINNPNGHTSEEWLEELQNIKEHYTPLVEIINQGIANAAALFSAGYGGLKVVDNDYYASYGIAVNNEFEGRVAFIYYFAHVLYINGRYLNADFAITQHAHKHDITSNDNINKIILSTKPHDYLVKRGICIFCHERSLNLFKTMCKACGRKR